MADYEKGYGKRPLWQWIAIYLVIGGIIYGAIYFLFFNKGYSLKGQSGTNQQTTQPKGY